MSDIKDIELRVVRIIAAACKRDPSTVPLESTFDQLGLESLDALEIAFDIESEFDVAIPDNVAFAFKSVRDVVNALSAQKLAEATKPA